MTTDVEELVYTRQEAAARLKISLRKVDQLRKSGELASFTIGDRRLFKASALRAYIEGA